MAHGCFWNVKASILRFMPQAVSVCVCVFVCFASGLRAIQFQHVQLFRSDG